MKPADSQMSRNQTPNKKIIKPPTRKIGQERDEDDDKGGIQDVRMKDETVKTKAISKSKNEFLTRSEVTSNSMRDTTMNMDDIDDAGSVKSLKGGNAGQTQVEGKMMDQSQAADKPKQSLASLIMPQGMDAIFKAQEANNSQSAVKTLNSTS